MKAYAPASDGNDPVRYANEMVTALGGETTADGAAITLDTRLEELSEAQMRKVQDAIVGAEGTIEGHHAPARERESARGRSASGSRICPDAGARPGERALLAGLAAARGAA